jgi:alanyl-tRNA synthetase
LGNEYDIIVNNLVASNGLHAGNIIKELAKEIKGGGGGQAFFATAGGNDVSGLGKVVEKGKVVGVKIILET